MLRLRWRKWQQRKCAVLSSLPRRYDDRYWYGRVIRPGQVKSRQGRLLAEITRRMVVGTEAAVTRVIAVTRGGTAINTSYIERLNATFRAHLAPLARLGRGIAHATALVESGMWLVGCAYNFCWTHESLRLRAIGGAQVAGADAGHGRWAGRPCVDYGRDVVLSRPAPRADGHDDTAARPDARLWPSPPLPRPPRAATEGEGRMSTLPWGGTRQFYVAVNKSGPHPAGNG